jgi:threonine/homoserine/homoserine lactone efflux protein
VTGNLLPFVALIAVLVLLPGPAVTLVMKNAVLRGGGSALTTAAGVFVADLVWVLASVAGLTAVLVASETAFEALRLAGAAYLVYIGLRLLLSRHDAAVPDADAARRSVSTARAFREGVLCDLSNPKTLLVFTSVIPQFLPSGRHVADAAVYGVVFAILGFLSLLLYAVAFASARRAVARPRLKRALLRASGGVLVVFGVRLAA